MSPAQIAEQAEQDEQILALARGFDALIETIQKLTWQERELRSKLQFAHDEYLKLADQLPNRSATETEVAEKISPAPFQKNNRDASADTTGWIYDVEKAGYVTATEFEAIAKGLEAYRSLADKRVARDENHQVNNNTCLVAVDAKVRSSIERDFTTNGVQGNLRCPFAIPNGNEETPPKLANGKSDTCARDFDPIRAESLQESGSASVRDAAPRCPIRYLDDHSPEEVAKYFENHKHEIPRSHAICIQRYQKDSQSIRQLDEKYGDMVNMIKGLGLYHQPYLPSNQEPSRPGGTASVSVGRVEKWAENVSAKSPKLEVMSVSQEEGDAEAEERQSHFDRPLRDVRVGESPSRPWGIHVPISQEVPQSAIVSPIAPVAGASGTPLANYDGATPDRSSISTPVPEKLKPSPGAGGCPFHAFANKDEPPANTFPGSAAADIETENKAPHQPANDFDPPPKPSEFHPPSASPAQPKMVFHGPVFFGYSAEQAATLIQQLGQSSVPK
ncbi:hypothetical protein AJ79_07660 [Helicocarpus griseus UAMH5409]|uniref:Uncharacterized protein n=1 Tax=Helicocarpus griseus UAMH5409 TaxID=1447875 RepID=A0A2B7X0K2_9EURO|nr:hypothetical protein AJ79_07660 [Helicocarpus griseus UAMH5409]